MNKQTYKHIIKRMKKDIIIFKHRALNMESDLSTGSTVDKLAQERY